jgi:hypothetical protein
MKTDSILEQPTLNQVLQDRIDLMLLPAQACGINNAELLVRLRYNNLLYSI